jgi:hypothetical protein
MEEANLMAGKGKCPTPKKSTWGKFKTGAKMWGSDPKKAAKRLKRNVKSYVHKKTAPKKRK